MSIEIQNASDKQEALQELRWGLKQINLSSKTFSHGYFE